MACIEWYLRGQQTASREFDGVLVSNVLGSHSTILAIWPFGPEAAQSKDRRWEAIGPFYN